MSASVFGQGYALESSWLCFRISESVPGLSASRSTKCVMLEAMAHAGCSLVNDCEAMQDMLHKACCNGNGYVSITTSAATCRTAAFEESKSSPAIHCRRRIAVCSHCIGHALSRMHAARSSKYTAHLRCRWPKMQAWFHHIVNCSPAGRYYHLYLCQAV